MLSCRRDVSWLALTFGAGFARDHVGHEQVLVEHLFTGRIDSDNIYQGGAWLARAVILLQDETVQQTVN